MDSPWQVPLPLEKYTTSRVVVYFYKGSWIPISFLPLIDAIELQRKAVGSGMNIFVFPPDLDPRTFDIAIAESGPSIASMLEQTEILTNNLQYTKLYPSQNSRSLEARLVS